MWPPSSATQVLNYSFPHDMGMVGLRQLFVVAPASSLHHSSLNEQNLMAEGLDGGGSNPATALGVGLGVIPLFTAAPCLAEDGSGNNRNRGGAGIQLWQSQKSLMLDNNSGHHHNTASVMQAIGGSSSSSTATCQDCGNQAKKDCCHRRCRTCCKSRGYDCSTHVKSTWVPASRRRERQLLAGSTGASSASISLSGSGVKKARLVNSSAPATTTSHTSNSNTPPRSFETTSCHQDAGFKETLRGQIMAPAKFKFVKLTSINDREDEFAYQALVNIGGHVFKGLLYDQGEESGGREHQSQGMPNLSDLHLGGGGSGGMQKGGCSSAGIDAPLADVYGGGGSGSGGVMAGGGSGYGIPIIN